MSLDYAAIQFFYITFLFRYFNMTRLPSPYPHQVVTDWIAANDDNAHALSVVRTPRNFTQIDGPSPLDYDVATRRARNAQAEAIAAISRTIGTAIGRIVSNTIGSLRDNWRTRREIQRLSYLTPRVLDDIGISYEIRARAQALQAYRQPDRFYLHF
jgi:uncharacterized protein YjiS (DUF1127 family)